MRMTASWSGSKRTYRIQVCGAKMRPNGELPSDHYADRRRQTPALRREAHRAVQRPSACSGVKALRNTSDARAASRQAALAFRSLDPFRALREPDRRRRDEERPFPLRTKNWQRNPKNNRLTVLPSCEALRAAIDHAWRIRSLEKASAADEPTASLVGCHLFRQRDQRRSGGRSAPVFNQAIPGFWGSPPT